MDIVSKERRSWNMSRIRGKDTKPEIAVRSLLHKLGYRFRIHVKSLPGTPDIVLPKHKTVLLVHGCFWHRHRGCRFAYALKSRVAFWEAKFSATIERDQRVYRQLRKSGWRAITVWECETKKLDILKSRLLRLLG